VENYFNKSAWGVSSNGFKQFERGKSGVLGVDLPECAPWTATFSRLAYRLRRCGERILLGWEGQLWWMWVFSAPQGHEVASGTGIRPMVVARQVWRGNRTPRGAQTQSILVSFLQTCRQQLQPASPLIQNLRTSSVALSPKDWA
jgi:hypothetical protein